MRICRPDYKASKQTRASPLWLCVRGSSSPSVRLPACSQRPSEAIRSLHADNEVCRRIVQWQDFYCCENTMSKAKGLFPFMTRGAHGITEGSQSRSSDRTGFWKQKLRQRPQRRAACWLALIGLSSRLSHSTQTTNPGETSTHIRLCFPTSITN